jgi:hypothetical protein
MTCDKCGSTKDVSEWESPRYKHLCAECKINLALSDPDFQDKLTRVVKGEVETFPPFPPDTLMN